MTGHAQDIDVVVQRCGGSASRTGADCTAYAEYRIDTGYIELFACARHLQAAVRSWTVDYEEGAVMVNPAWKRRRD